MPQSFLLSSGSSSSMAWAMSCSWKSFRQSGSLPEVRMLRNREMRVSAISRVDEFTVIHSHVGILLWKKRDTRPAQTDVRAQLESPS